MSQVIKTADVDYTEKAVLHGSYSYNRVLPLGNSSFTIGSSQVESLIQLPPSVANFRKSRIEFDVYIPELNAAYTWMWNHCLAPFSQIVLQTRDGVALANIDVCDVYSRVSHVKKHPVGDFLTYDKSPAFLTAAARFGRGGNFSRTDSIKTSTPIAFDTNGSIVASTGGLANSNLSYTDVSEFIRGGLGDGAAAGDLYQTVSIDGGLLEDTIMALDKNLYFGNGLQLRLVFNPAAAWGWRNTSATVPLTGLSALTEVQVSNLRYTMAVQTNPMIRDEIIRKVQTEGMTFLTPYLFAFQQTLTGNNQSVQIRLNSGHGEKLKHITHAVFNATSTGPLRHDIDNSGENKVVSYQTQLDNENIQQNAVVCADDEEFLVQQDLIRGSVVQSSGMLKHNFSHTDSYISGKMCNYSKHLDENDGLDLSQEKIWGIYQTTAGNPLRHYTFAVCQRRVMIAPGGSAVMFVAPMQNGGML